ncbi:hypothetical protein Chor_017274 [Crotalus horridus]
MRIQPLRTPRDENIYECVAQNSVAEITVNAKLTVLRDSAELLMFRANLIRTGAKRFLPQTSCGIHQSEYFRDCSSEWGMQMRLPLTRGHGETEQESDSAGPLPRLKDSRQEVAFKSSPTATVGISRAWNKQRDMEEGGDGNRNCHREGNRVYMATSPSPEDQLPPGFPVIDMGPQLKVVERTRTATMLCAASGNPDPEITWFKDFLPVDPSASNGRIKQLRSDPPSLNLRHKEKQMS